MKELNLIYMMTKFSNELSTSLFLFHYSFSGSTNFLIMRFLSIKSSAILLVLASDEFGGGIGGVMGTSLFGGDKRDTASLMLSAATEGDTAKVTKYLKSKVDVDSINAEGRTAWMEAAIHGHIDTAKVLIAAGANPNLEDKDGLTALMVETRKGNLQTVQALIAAGADVNHQDKFGQTALMDAVSMGRVRIIEQLIGSKADVKKANNLGSTALHIAVQRGNKYIVDLLLGKGADVNAVWQLDDHTKVTALTLAARNRSRDIAIALLHIQRTEDNKTKLVTNASLTETEKKWLDCEVNRWRGLSKELCT
jgi:ankyrin repeat protein